MRVSKLFFVLGGITLAMLLLLGVFHLGSRADSLATFTVDSTADATDAAPGDGICETAVGNSICTLRAAIQESNALAGADVIELPAGTYLLTIPGANENNATTGDLDITGPLTINGAGATTTIIDANNLDRVLDIHPSGTLSLHDVTLRGGQVGSSANGGGINMFTGNLTVTDSIITSNTAGWGGGIAQLTSSPQMIISNTIISGNSSTNGAGGGLLIGAANLQISNSLISGNSSQQEGGGLVIYCCYLTVMNSVVEDNTAVTMGGGIFNSSDGLVISSTIQNNIANGSDLNAPGGGGIVNAGSLTVSNSQVISNHAPNYGGGGLLNADSLILENTEVAYNTADSGGGMYNYDATAVIMATDVLIWQNSATIGGGIYGSAGTITLTNSLVDNNTAVDMGGGVFIFPDAEGVVISSTIQNNVANGTTLPWSGGGGFFNMGLLTVEASQVISNHAPNYGGGGLMNMQTLLMENTRIAQNNANYGGGLYNYEAAASVIGTDLTFDQNVALRGGAIESLTGTLTLNNSTISHNIATYDAGGIFVARGNGSFTNVTVSGNEAGGDGSGIYVYEQDFAILNSTIVSNTAQGGAVYIYDAQSVLTLTNSIIANNQWFNCAGYRPLSGGHNLDSSNNCDLNGPGDLENTNPLLGPLQNNGGNTETHTFVGASPAIDGGDNASCPATDQRGILRPQGPVCDIGAVEFVLPDPPTPTPTATPTDTPTATPTFTPSPTPTNTPSPTPTDTPSPTFTPTNTPSPTATGTVTMTATATFTPTPTATATATHTSTATPTMTPTTEPPTYAVYLPVVIR